MLSEPGRRGLWTLPELMESSSLSLQSFPQLLGKRRAFPTATHRPYYWLYILDRWEEPATVTSSA